MFIRRNNVLAHNWLNLTAAQGQAPPRKASTARVIVAMRGRGGRHPSRGIPEEPTPGERRAAMTVVQTPKRVFGIDLENCADVWLGGVPADPLAAAHE